MQLACGQSLCGFTVETADPLPEIEGTAYTLRHGASGARLLYLANDDANKAFSISFKTPPADDTGVFHILEHSVLCGSRKFPVKEPFVNLLKTSMQTFLNAMTFPDKTMYPVASTNEQDLLNLMDVYLDAVLHPAIYDKRSIFEQEGWHLELADDGELAYNGVVYNEMKGALSSPDSVLYDALSAALFPDTAYRFESGGTPAAIPDLTYEAFLDAHRRHYRLDNSYLMLYGNLDAQRVLSFLDERYLSPVAAEQGAPSPASAPNELALQAPVTAHGIRKPMRTAPENAMCGAAFVIGTAQDRRRLIATDILMDALLGSNEAPLKRALLDAGICDDVTGFLSDGVLQPFVVVQAKGVRDGALDKMMDVIRKTCERLEQNGIDRSIIEGAISHAEFVMREHDFGMADGVALAMSSMAGWLYDESMATAYLRYEDDFAALRATVDDGAFERLMRRIFLDNDHCASVDLVPEPDVDDSEASRLAALSATLDNEARARIECDVDELRRAQTEPDDPQAVAALPRLSLADVGDAPAQPTYEPSAVAGVPCIVHHVSTHGIAYVYRYFDAGDLDADDLCLLSLLGLLLGKLDTAQHTASELDVLVQNELGSLSFFPEFFESDADIDAVAPRFVVGASALSEHVSSLADIPWEVLRQTSFADHGKIRSILVQRRVALEQGFADAGHTFALIRANAHVTRAGALRDLTGGVGFYRFLKGLLASFEERAEELSERLEELCGRMFCADRCTMSVAAAPSDLKQLERSDALHTAEDLARSAPHAPEPVYASEQAAEPLAPAREGFIVPSDVVYAACSYDLRALGIPWSGSWQVAAQALSLDYLWTEVRVKGGAYGVGYQAARSGSARFYSYRDPHLDETLARFRAAGSWLASWQPSDDELEGYIVSTVAGIDAPRKPRDLVRRQFGDFMHGRTPSSRLRIRDEVVATTLDELHALAARVEQGALAGALAAFGNKGIIESSAEGFHPIDLLAEEPASGESALDAYRVK